MARYFIFVTAEMPVDRVNHFLSVQKEEQKKNKLDQSMYTVLRDRNVPYEDFKKGPTEEPIDEFKSGFIDAHDDELWGTLQRYFDYESTLDHASYILDETIIVLDKRSADEDTAVMLYRKEDDGQKTRWRVPFKFVWDIVTQLPFMEESPYLESIDDDGVISMTKVYEKKGVPWDRGDR